MFSQEEADKHIDHLKELLSQIDLDKITILTGDNGTGKSLIRKLVTTRVVKERKKKAKSVSMDTRTQSNPEWGAFSSVMHDLSWIATSINTLTLLKGVFTAIKNENSDTGYLILDEFEIGFSEETVLAIANYINKEMEDIKIGVLIITHSRLAVKTLKADDFINIQGKTKEEWLNREIIPTDLSKLEDNTLFEAIRERLK